MPQDAHAGLSPVRNRFDYASAMHPTSSLRDPPPNATPPGGRSRSNSGAGHRDREQRERERERERERDRDRDRDQRERDDERKGKGREREDAEEASRPEKRSRTGGRSGRHSGDSPLSQSKNSSGPSPPAAADPTERKQRPASLTVKPIGFAASREARRDEGDQPIPSPVVLGFDFKSIDEDQLKTVRDTISIKEQQQALIAQRRKEMAASQPSTPRELTFKGWTPKDPEKRGVGARREKTRDKVERMSIVTSTSDKDVVPGSKSAPLNQGLASQQDSPSEPPSGSQTAMPQHILPPMHYPGHPHSAHHLADPRTAPLDHPRSARHDDNFARQQQPYYPPRASISTHPASATRQDTRYPPELPRSQHQQQQPRTADRRTFPVPALQHPNSARYPVSPHAPQHPMPGPSMRNGGRANGYSLSPSPPNHQREQFLAPFSQLYDILASVEQLRYTLQDMLHQSEQSYAAQMAATNEFKSTAAQASNLLGTLQQSADSLKEMVRYEVDRAQGGSRREVDELRERVRQLEERGGR